MKVLMMLVPVLVLAGCGRRRRSVHTLGLEEAGDGDSATFQSGAVGFREGVLLVALDVDGSHNLTLRAVHHRYDDLRSGAAEGGEIPRVFGYVAREDGLPGGDCRAAQALGDRETGINGRSGTVEG